MSSKRSSSTQSSSSSVAIIEGNDDLLIEILLFLPAKSLVRFKLVRKRWCSLISAPSFCHRHTLHHPRRQHHETQPLYILRSRHESKYSVCNPAVPGFFPFPLCCESPFVTILQSCNGLLLLRCSEKEYGRNHYYVVNPTTMQIRDLSPLPFRAVSGIYLMFDPSLSPHYRVVCFVYFKNIYTRVYLYDSETHKWKTKAETITRKMVYHDGIYFNGGICFLRVGSSSCRFTPYNLSKIPGLPRLPRYPSYDSYHRNYIGLGSNGVLLLFSKLEGNVLDVYETKDIENGWTNKYQVDFNPILGELCSLCVVGMIGGEDPSLLFVMHGKLMIYRFCDSVFEVLLEDLQGW